MLRGTGGGTTAGWGDCIVVSASPPPPGPTEQGNRHTEGGAGTLNRKSRFLSFHNNHTNLPPTGRAADPLLADRWKWNFGDVRWE